MAFRIDDDENRIQDLKDQIDKLEIQTFSPEVVARNESTRNTGIQTGDAAATNAYPQWMPIRDFGSVGNLTLDILLNRTDSHVAKLIAIGDIDFAFSLPPGTNKKMEFILDVTVDATGGYTFNLLNNILPAGISIDNTANARTVIRFTTTDGGVTYYAEDISNPATGSGDNLGDHTATEDLEMSTFKIVNTSEIDFTQAGNIVSFPTTLRINVPEAVDKIEFATQNVVRMTMSTFNIDMLGNKIANTNDIVPIDNTVTLGVTNGEFGKLFVRDIRLGDDGSSFKGEMTNIGHLDFIDNAATPVAAVSLYSDGVDLFANTGGGIINFSDIGDVTLSNLTIDTDKSWLGFNITDLGSIGSNAGIVPGSGFIRMGTGEELRWKNVVGDDDVIISAGDDALGNDAIIFGTEGTTILTLTLLNMDVKDTNIIGTGDILPRGQVHTLGDTFDYFAKVFADNILPQSSSVNNNLYGLAKTGNTLYVNYNDTDVDAAFSIYEQGLESFRFYNPSSTVNEFHIGSSTVFTAEEEYAIQMGENSTSSARISFIEGVGTDLILDRAGAGADQGVQISGSGLSIARFLSDSIKIFQKLNVNSQDMTNVKNIFADTSGNSIIGEFQPSNGGFDYILRDRISWESDSATYIEMNGTALSIVSDDAMVISSIDPMTISILASTGVNFLVAGSLRVTIQDNNLVLSDGTDITMLGSSPEISGVNKISMPGLITTTAEIDGVSEINFTGVTSFILNLGTLFFDSDHVIGIGLNELLYSVALTQFHQFDVDSESIFEIKESIIEAFQPLNMNAKKITSLLDPTSDQDAATKKYVDDTIAITNSIFEGDSNVTVSDTGAGDVTTNIDNIDMMITKADGTTLLSHTPNSNPTLLHFFRDDSSPAINDTISDIHFDGKSNLGTRTTYGHLKVNILDPVIGDLSSEMVVTLFERNFVYNALQMREGELSIFRVSPGGFSGGDFESVEFTLTKSQPNSVSDPLDIGRINFDYEIASNLNRHASILVQNNNVSDAGIMHFEVRANNNTLQTGMSIEGDPSSNNVTIHLLGNLLTLDSNQTTQISGSVSNEISFLTASSIRMEINNSSIIMLEELSMFNLNKITNVNDPTNPQDVVTLQYFNDNVGGGGVTEDQSPVTWTGIHSFNGTSISINSPNIFLGDQTTDLIFGAGRLQRDWIPSLDSLFLLGDSTHYWGSVFFDTLNINNGLGIIRADSSGVEIRATTVGDSIELQTEGTNTRARFENGAITFFEPFEVNDNIIIDGGNIIHANDSVQCGFAITNEITSPGTEGTMQMPRTSDSSPDASDLDTDFGSALGCYGLLTLGGLPATPIFVIKVGTSPSTWRGFLMFPSGNTVAVEFT